MPPCGPPPAGSIRARGTATTVPVALILGRVMEVSVANSYSGWENYQRLLVRAIAPLDGSQLDLRAAPHLWSIRTLANHVVAARAWWFHSWMGEGGPEFAPMADFDEGEEAE